MSRKCTEQLRAGATIAAYSAPHVYCEFNSFFLCIAMTIKVPKFILYCVFFSLYLDLFRQPRRVTTIY